MTNHEDNEEKKTFQVVDRRRFDSAGNSKAESISTATVPIGSESPAAATEKQTSSREFHMESSKPTESQVNFSSFVMSLATQAMVQLGQMSPPPGFDIPVDKEAGRGTIDILSMLQQKTVGNLSNEEAKLLEEILHSLRVAYVRK